MSKLLSMRDAISENLPDGASVALSADRHLLATIGEGVSARVWRLPEAELVHAVQAVNGRVAFSPVAPLYKGRPRRDIMWNWRGHRSTTRIRRNLIPTARSTTARVFPFVFRAARRGWRMGA